MGKHKSVILITTAALAILPTLFVFAQKSADKKIEFSIGLEKNTYVVSEPIWVDSLGRYYLNHVERDSSGVQALYEGYLCGIKAVCDNNGVDLDTVWGATSGYPGPYSWSFICMDSELPGGCVQKTIIHELGHQRANLTHLCLDEFTMSPDHNAPNCVMGQGEVAICTGEDLTTHPEFCGYCCNRIEVVDW